MAEFFDSAWAVMALALRLTVVATRMQISFSGKPAPWISTISYIRPEYGTEFIALLETYIALLHPKYGFQPNPLFKIAFRCLNGLG